MKQIKVAIESIIRTWEEVTLICMNSAWLKEWPDVCHEFTGFEVEKAITRDIFQLASQVGLDEVDADNVEELLVSHGSSLSNEELQELDEHHAMQEAKDNGDSEPEKFLNTKTLSDANKMLCDALELVVENDPDME